MAQRASLPYGVGEARAEAEGEVALARLALDDGELEHAAAHRRNAVASDPSLADADTDLAGLAYSGGRRRSALPADRPGSTPAPSRRAPT